MEAIARAAPPGSYVTRQYRGDLPILVVYGPGAPDRQVAIRKHREAGGRVHVFDLAYWNRKNHLRCAVNAQHPTVEQMDATPAAGREYPDLREDGDPAGHILLVGLGRKTRVQFGYDGADWERVVYERLVDRFPGREIRFRPKGRDSARLPCATSEEPTIEAALRRCALVVCRHSNVAIDACVAGVPVECEAGAAHWLYRHCTTPDALARRDLLARVAWWQWGPHEAPECWDFMLTR